MLRPTWAEVDLGAIAHNIQAIREHIGSGTMFMAVVKANAYGHGAVPVAKTAVAQGADYVGVATADEAVELREAGITAPVLVLGTSIPGCGEDKLVELGITQGICSLELAQALNDVAASLGKKALVHVKVDTGMGRIGVAPEEGVAFIQDLKKLPNLEVEGIYTHFAASDEEDKTFTEEQFNRFRWLLDQLAAQGIAIPLQHACNSAAVLDFPHMYLNMVRPGSLMYGVFPSPFVSRSVDLRPALSLKTRIVYLKDVEAETKLSYGLTHTVATKTTIATLPIGYADGYRRHFSNKSDALVRGQRVSQVGRVCMDQCLLDVGAVSGVQCGDEVVLIGQQGEQVITLEELAQLAGTLELDLTAGIGKRVPRVYKGQ